MKVANAPTTTAWTLQGVYTLYTVKYILSAYTLSMAEFERNIKMPSKKPTIMIRTTEETKQKFEYICNKENRSMSNQLEKMILDLIKQYETEHEKINIQKTINMGDNNGTINM